jgi:hypothetical protein
MSDWFRSVPHALDSIAFTVNVRSFLIVLSPWCVTSTKVSARNHGRACPVLAKQMCATTAAHRENEAGCHEKSTASSFILYPLPEVDDPD